MILCGRHLPLPARRKSNGTQLLEELMPKIVPHLHSQAVERLVSHLQCVLNGTIAQYECAVNTW